MGEQDLAAILLVELFELLGALKRCTCCGEVKTLAPSEVAGDSKSGVKSDGEGGEGEFFDLPLVEKWFAFGAHL